MIGGAGWKVSCFGLRVMFGLDLLRNSGLIVEKDSEVEFVGS